MQWQLRVEDEEKWTSLRHDISRVTISDLIRNVLQISGTGTNDEDLTEG